ncbi:MAG TPA: hypothetical protein VIO57_16450 [Chloroflexota bacterium]
MRPIHPIVKRFERELSLLEAIFLREQTAVISGGFWTAGRALSAQAYVTIRLTDAWGRFCRRLILTCASGMVFTLGGTPVPRSPRVRSGQSPIEALWDQYPNPRRKREQAWEPDWHIIQQALDAARRLAIQNELQVTLGLGITSPAPEELRAVRNFLAHRSSVTNTKIDGLRQRIGLAASSEPERVLRYAAVNGKALFQDWCDDLRQRARTAAQ